jgi:hypothetical protein
MQQDILPAFLDIAERWSLEADRFREPVLRQPALLALCANFLAYPTVKGAAVIHLLGLRITVTLATYRIEVNNNNMSLLQTLKKSLQNRRLGLWFRRLESLQRAIQRTETMSNRDKHCEPGLDDRCRDRDGEIRQKRGDTLVRTLRESYGPDFAQGVRGDTRLDTLRDRTGQSLSEMLKKR